MGEVSGVMGWFNMELKHGIIVNQTRKYAHYGDDIRLLAADMLLETF